MMSREQLRQEGVHAKRGTAVLQALLVTFLWSTSWVIIKIGLRDNLPALTFAGLRYTLAFLCLVPLVLLNSAHRHALLTLRRGDWSKLALLGLLFYTFTQGAQFLSLAYLPAAMVSLLLNLTPIVVGLTGVVFLAERPSGRQWVGIGISAVGVVIYFLPFVLLPEQWVGIGVAVLGVAANAVSSLMGRYVNYQSHLPSLVITFTSMGIGAILLLATGILAQGVGELSWQSWGLIFWLAVVNTAFAFTLWNQTLRVLTAVESSILNSFMLPQIALLAFFFLEETMTSKEMAGLVLVSLGVFIVQMRTYK